MNALKRRLKRLEIERKAKKDPPRYLVVAGPVCIIDPSVKAIVPEKDKLDSDQA